MQQIILYHWHCQAFSLFEVFVFITHKPSYLLNLTFQPLEQFTTSHEMTYYY